jgi:hypothetical protein
MSLKFEIRKKTAIVDVVETYFGKRLERPITKVATMAVINNPYGQNWQEDLSEIIEFGGKVGEILSAWGAELIGGAEKIQSLGKAAICGEGVELEIGQAAMHPEFGQGIRRALRFSPAKPLSFPPIRWGRWDTCSPSPCTTGKRCASAIISTRWR